MCIVHAFLIHKTNNSLFEEFTFFDSERLIRIVLKQSNAVELSVILLSA